MTSLLKLIFFLVLTAVAGAVPALGQQNASFIQTTIDLAQPKLVKVFGAGAGRVEGFATGIIVSGDGKILTSQGVFLDGKQVKVVMLDGSEHVATILKRDRVRQLALLKIELETPQFFEISELPVGEKGDWVIAICNAFKVADKSEPISATLGIISLRTEIEARLTRRDVAYKGELVLIDAITSNPGAAGGAVLTLDGKLVGMVGKIINSSETNTRLNYAVPNFILLDFIRNEGSVKTEPSAEVFQQAETGIVLFKFGGRNNPAYIDRVKRNSPAADVKLQADDMIVSMAGTKIGNVKDYQAVLETLRPDEEILIMVKRGGDIIRTRMTPRAKK